MWDTKIKELNLELKKLYGNKCVTLYIRKDRVWGRGTLPQKPWLSNQGVEYKTIYHTRHYFITKCLEKGIDAKDIASWVGNSPQIIYKHSKQA